MNMLQLRSKSGLVAALLSALLGACGGGGTASSTAAPEDTALSAEAASKQVGLMFC